MQPKLITVLLLTILCTNVFAQFQKGMRMPGAAIGTAAFSAGNTDYSGPAQIDSKIKNQTVNFSITPSAGRFINNHTAVGFSLLLNFSNQTLRRSAGGITDKKDHTNNIDYGAGVFMRYYLADIKSLKPFTHLYFNAGSGSTTSDGLVYVNGISGTDRISYDGKSSGRFFYNAGMNLGVTKMLNRNVGFDVFLGYGLSHTQFTSKTTQTYDFGNPSTPDTQAEFETTQKFTGHGLNIGIGLQVFLDKK